MNSQLQAKDLYNIFFQKDLTFVQELRDPKTPPSKTSTIITQFTPMTKSLYYSVSPLSRKKLLQDIEEDNRILEKYDNDTDYVEKMSNNQLGFYVEDFISCYFLCPVCGKNTLRKYTSATVPVVDIICVNKEYHLKNKKCFLFQIKTSLMYDYFNVRNHTISVGSEKYGIPAHIHKGSESLSNKIVVPGYFCLKLNEENNQIYKIDNENSFVLIPDYDDNSDEYYYTYVGKNIYKKNIIKWNPDMFDLLKIPDITTLTKIDYSILSETIIQNPYRNLRFID
jgi:hypothetical protein